MKRAFGLLVLFLLFVPIAFSQTVLQTGDMAVVTFNSDGTDAVGIVTFVDLTPGTTFLCTDNGFERGVAAGSYTWGNSEEVVQFTVTGSTITAGTVITIDQAITIPANITQTKLHGNFTGYLDQFTSSGDGLFILQGTWANGTIGSHDATFTGTYVWGFNSTPWTPDANIASGTAASHLPAELACSNNGFTHADNWQYLNSALKTGTKPALVAALTNPANWQSNNSAQFPVTTGPFSVTPGVTTATWTGAADDNWFNCQNWNTFLVPDMNTDVIFPSTTSLNSCVLQPGDTAMCNNIVFTEVGGNSLHGEGDPSKVLMVHGNLGILTAAVTDVLDFSDGINGTPDGHIYLYGSWANNSNEADFVQGESTVFFVGNTSQSIAIPPQTTEIFGNVVVRKTNLATLTLMDTMEVEGFLALDTGRVVTGTHHLYVSNDLPTAVIYNHDSSWVDGTLHREIMLAGGTFPFPVGTATHPQLAVVTFSAGHGISTLGSSFSSLLTGTIPNYTDVAGTYNVMLDGGIWDIAPVSGSLANTYNLHLYERGFTFTGPHHAVARRDNPASAWVPDGIHVSQNVTATQVDASRMAMTSFSEFCLATCILPVVMTHFEAEPLDNQTVRLDWGIALEENVAQYVVERVNSDGSLLSELGRLAAAGPGEYSLIDPTPTRGLNFYRLLEFTTNGELVEIGRAQAYLSSDLNQWVVYPNPATAAFGIQGDFANDVIEIQLIDLKGRLIMQSKSDLATLNRQLGIHSSNLPSGVYFLRLRDGNRASSQKVVKR